MRLFLDDLDALVQLLRQKADRVEITGDTFEADSADELADLPDRVLRTMSIDAIVDFKPDSESEEFIYSDTFMRVAFDPALGAYVLDHKSGSDLEVRGLIDATEQFLRRHRSRGRRIVGELYGSANGGMAIALVAGLVSALAVWAITGSIAWFYVFWLGMVLSFLGSLWVNRRLARTIIVTQRRKDAPSFWRRNRDAIVVGIVTGTVLSVLGVIVGYLFGRAA